MKVSEAIDRLEVGETGWVKATVDRINNEWKYIMAMPNTSSVYLLDGNDEISLTEPQGEKVEAHLAEHWNEDIGDVLWWNFPVEEPPYCGTPLDECFPKHKTHFTTVDMPTEIEQLKRWVVKFNDDDDNYQNYYFNGWMPDDPLDPNGNHCKTDKSVIKFTDKEQAEALATLIDGEVEEVAE